jgi:hypothetical protein
MSRIAYTAFYPSRPFWAVSKVNFNVLRVDGWFHDQMVEEVYSQGTDAYALKVCRDGRILIRISKLESSKPCELNQSIQETVRRWGNYLDYLNAFYLLLDSAMIEIDRLALFNLHEITNRDAFRVTYENEKSTGENIASESIASVFQNGRYLCNYRTDTPLECDPMIMMRHVVSLSAISHAGTLFEKIITSPGLEKSLASFAKSLSEYKVGNYETSLILAWFITEASLSSIWQSHLHSLNHDVANGSKRINRKRHDFLTGRDLPISVVSNMLELIGILDHGLFVDIDTVRGYRNRIVHTRGFTLGASEAQLSMKTALTMIERMWNLQLTPNLNYSVSGI